MPSSLGGRSDSDTGGYVCTVCGFEADEPQKHIYRYPRIPVPGFHMHPAELMKPKSPLDVKWSRADA